MPRELRDVWASGVTAASRPLSRRRPSGHGWRTWLAALVSLVWLLRRGRRGRRGRSGRINNRVVELSARSESMGSQRQIQAGEASCSVHTPENVLDSDTDDDQLSSANGPNRLQELKDAGAIVLGPQPSVDSSELREMFVKAKEVMLKQFEHDLSVEDSSQLLAAVLPAGAVSYKIQGTLLSIQLLGAISRLGCGSALVRRLEVLGRSRGVRFMIARVVNDADSLMFYRAMGFQEYPDSRMADNLQEWLRRPDPQALIRMCRCIPTSACEEIHESTQIVCPTSAGQVQDDDSSSSVSSEGDSSEEDVNDVIKSQNFATSTSAALAGALRRAKPDVGRR